MSTVASGIGGQSPPISLEYGGQLYRLRSLSFAMLSELGNWMLEREAAARIKSDMPLVEVGLLTPPQVIARKDQFVEDAVVHGRYSLGSVRMMAMFGALKDASENPAGMEERLGELFEPTMKLFSLIIGCDIDTVINLYHGAGEELMAKMNLVMKQSLPDPKGQPAGMPAS